MTQKLTIREFFKRFPDDDACLEHLMKVRFGLRRTCRKCGKDATFHRIKARKAYQCAHCADHIYPAAGTIFHRSSTPLTMWFYAIYLFVTTRHGVSGKELERQLGVTYKTAWRIGQQIRQLTRQADFEGMLKGHVEADEAYVGGRRPGKRGRGALGKTIVMGLQERGGAMKAVVIPDVKLKTLREVVHKTVERSATVSTDELMSYGLLNGDGYKHGAVKHSAKEWTVYDYRTRDVHHTNNVENFWRHFKNAVKSTHIHVSKKYMQRYLDEFTFRRNFRQRENAMFDLLLGSL